MVFEINEPCGLKTSSNLVRDGELCCIVPRKKLREVYELAIACQLQTDLKMDSNTYRNERIVLVHSRFHL